MFNKWIVILMSNFKALISELVGEHISFKFQFSKSDMKVMLKFPYLKHLLSNESQIDLFKRKNKIPQIKFVSPKSFLLESRDRKVQRPCHWLYMFQQWPLSADYDLKYLLRCKINAKLCCKFDINSVIFLLNPILLTTDFINQLIFARFVLDFIFTPQVSKFWILSTQK